MRLWSKMAAVAALLTAVVGGGTAANAQTPVNPLLPTTGTREIGLSGNFVFEPEESQDLRVFYGPFLNPNLQIGGEIGFINPSVGEEQFDITAVVNYHFPGSSALLPYVGASLGYADYGANDSFIYGVQGGVKYFLNQNVSANAQLVWRRVEDADDDDVRINLGLSVYLR